MESIIQIFRMSELSVSTRIKIIMKLGEAINYQFGSYVTEGLVYELVLALDPDNEIVNNKRYTRHIHEEVE